MNSAPDDDDLLVRPQLSVIRTVALELGEPAYFANPTPGQRNGSQEQLPASEVVFSHRSQTFIENLKFLSGTFPGEVIHTTDRSGQTQVLPATPSLYQSATRSRYGHASSGRIVTRTRQDAQFLKLGEACSSNSTQLADPRVKYGTGGSGRNTTLMASWQSSATPRQFAHESRMSSQLTHRPETEDLPPLAGRNTP